MTDPQQGDALEAAAREVYANVTFNVPSTRDVAEVVAILRRHGLRAPAPDPDRALLVSFIVSVRDQLDDAIHEGGVPPTDMEIADALNSAARALAAPAERDAIAPEEA